MRPLRLRVGEDAVPFREGAVRVGGLDLLVEVSPAGSGTRLAGAQLGLPRTDVPAVVDNPDWSTAGFAVTIPLSSVPFGATTLTLAAHTPERGTWLSSVQVVVPSLGSVPAAAVVTPVAMPVVVPTVGPRIRAEIQAPQTGDTVGRSFAVQVLAPESVAVGLLFAFRHPEHERRIAFKVEERRSWAAQAVRVMKTLDGNEPARLLAPQTQLVPSGCELSAPAAPAL